MLTPEQWKRLRRIGERHHELRLGQLIANAVHVDRLFYMTDAALIEFLDRYPNGDTDSG